MTGSASLSICGDVERPARLALAEPGSLMNAELVADFHCREGWSRLGDAGAECGSGPCSRSPGSNAKPVAAAVRACHHR